MKRIIGTIAALTMVAAMTACSSGGSTAGGGASSAAETASTEAAAPAEASTAEASTQSTEESGGSGEQYDIAIIPWAMFEEFGVDVVNGAQIVADEKGINLINPDANGDMQKEISIIEDLVQQQVDAVVIAPVDAEAVVPYIDMMTEAGIVVVNYDIETTATCDAYVMSDHYAGGQLTGEEFLKKHGTTGKVLIVDDVPGVTTAELRNAGFEDYLKENAPDIEIIHQLSTGTRDTHRATIENMINAHPDLTGMFCFMGDIAIPAYNVCKTLDRQDILIAGYDATPEQVEIMKNDGPECNLVCSVALYPKNIGRVAMEAAYDLLEGNLESGTRISTANGMLLPEDAETFEDLLVAQ